MQLLTNLDNKGEQPAGILVTTAGLVRADGAAKFFVVPIGNTSPNLNIG